MQPGTVGLRVLLLVVALVVMGSRASTQTPPFGFELFEQYLEALRQQAGIPGLSAAVVSHGRIAWENGFGLRNIEQNQPALPDTPYPLVDLTEPLAAALVLQCADRGLLDLDAPVARTGSFPVEPGATARQVLGHISRGRFQFEPDVFAALGPTIENCHGTSYRRALMEAILERLAMQDSVAGHDLEDPVVRQLAGLDDEDGRRITAVLARMAQPYRLERRGRSVPSGYPPRHLSPATGLISTVRDLARFDAGLNDFTLVRESTLAMAWTNVVSNQGLPQPTGLGWFVQSHRGERLVWHYGLWRDSASSLFVKVPARGLTLILLANSDGLAESFGLDAGDVTRSPFARVFLQLFI